MSSRRTLILLLAVGLGLVAAFFLYTYVNRIEDDVEARYQPTNVLKASTEIPVNTLGETAIEQSLVETGQISREFLPDGAVFNSDAIRGRVALFDIPAGLTITEGMFVSSEQVQQSFRRRLEKPDFTTVTVRVDDVRGVGGLLVPGDEVNIFAAIPQQLTDEQRQQALTEANLQPTDLAFEPASYVALLYQKVHVLAVGTTTVRLPGETVASTGDGSGPTNNSEEVDVGLITLNVPTEAARNIISWLDTLYLSLVPEDYEVVDIEGPPAVWGENDFPGQSDQKTPYGPDGNGRGDE